jgi:hypothetical protein
MRTSRQSVLSTAESDSEVDGPEPHSTPHRGTLAPLSICNQKTALWRAECLALWRTAPPRTAERLGAIAIATVGASGRGFGSA